MRAAPGKPSPQEQLPADVLELGIHVRRVLPPPIPGSRRVVGSDLVGNLAKPVF
jgi:hypothetical protein